DKGVSMQSWKFAESDEASNRLMGDVNTDGKFNIADIVLLKKWLLAVPDVELADWKAADLCEDGKLNVFDLCVMKHELISK
ncbi:MAG: dockerin type I repeat-containing protein, partial [Oscillospiraceae bacterium]